MKIGTANQLTTAHLLGCLARYVTRPSPQTENIVQITHEHLIVP